MSGTGATPPVRPPLGYGRVVPAARRPAHPRRVALLVHDGVRLLDLTGPLEVLSTASALGAPYETFLCGIAEGPVVTSSGLAAQIDATVDEVMRADDPIHTLVVPGSLDLPRLRPDAELVDAVRQLSARAERTVSVCTGAFLLAEAGLLSGRRATTHWRHADVLQGWHRDVLVESDALYVEDGDVWTSAGVSAGIDLALALVERDHGPRLALDAARDMVVFLHRPGGQSQFSVPMNAPRPRSRPLRAALDALHADPSADHSLTALSGRVSVSARHVTRLFAQELGTTPAAYVESVRVEAARRLLEEGHTVAAAARRSGFGSDETLRRTFSRSMGVTPSAYRSRFSARDRSLQPDPGPTPQDGAATGQPSSRPSAMPSG